MSWKLVQTEKAYNSQSNNTFIIANDNKNFSTNKIEMNKTLKTKGLNAVKITSTAAYQKAKTRGAKRNKVSVFRPKKWYVTLPVGQTLTEEVVSTF